MGGYVKRAGQRWGLGGGGLGMKALEAEGTMQVKVWRNGSAWLI